MIKVLLLACLAGLASAQYGQGSRSGPDGVRNRYFILGHGRGPISTSLGSGVYGASLNQGSYRPSTSGHGYRPAASSGHGSSHGLGGSSLGGYGVQNGGYGGDNGGHGGHNAGYGGHNGGYGRQSGGHASLAPVHIPAEPAYAPAPRSYAPVVRSSNHGSYAPSANLGHRAPTRSSYGGHDDLAQPTPYDFGYDAHNEHGDQQSRQETGDGHGNVRGSYGYRDSYGIFRHVDYVADHHGFRANVRTNEPGTAPQDPADVSLHVEHGGQNSGY